VAQGVWRGFAAPKGLPPEIAAQHETAIRKAGDEDNGKALKSLGLAK
jgi:putative tricarboxylic transport membrane protein